MPAVNACASSRIDVVLGLFEHSFGNISRFQPIATCTWAKMWTAAVQLGMHSNGNSNWWCTGCPCRVLFFCWFFFHSFSVPFVLIAKLVYVLVSNTDHKKNLNEITSYLLLFHFYWFWLIFLLFDLSSILKFTCCSYFHSHWKLLLRSQVYNFCVIFI